MKLVFAGTGDARAYVLSLADNGEKVIVCTATPYGASLYPAHDNILQVYGHPMEVEEMENIVRSHAIDMIVDATHPYAVNISANIRKVSQKTGVPVEVFQRKSDLSDEIREQVTVVGDYKEASEVLLNTSGNILLTIGSNHIEDFAVGGLRERLVVRVLPTGMAIEKCVRHGLQPGQIIAMQGPFSVEMNSVIYRDFKINHMVTKDSGAPGGVIEKIQPALDAGIQVVLIERPGSVIGSKSE